MTTFLGIKSAISRFIEKQSLGVKVALSMVAVIIVFGGTVAGLGLAGSVSRPEIFGAGTTKISDVIGDDKPVTTQAVQETSVQTATGEVQSQPTQNATVAPQPGQPVVTAPQTSDASQPPSPPKPSAPTPTNPEPTFSITFDKSTLSEESSNSEAIAAFTIVRDAGHTTMITTSVTPSSNGVSCKIDASRKITLSLQQGVASGIYGCIFTATDGITTITEEISFGYLSVSPSA